MKGYQRFIAYVYEYKQGKKEKNCGFVKVEEKNQRFQMEVHLKCPGLLANLECEIYGFIREQGLMQGIRIGTAITNEGNIEYAMECDGKNMGEMGIDWHEFGGMILKIGEEVFWGTEWDDKRIRPEYFKEFKKVAEAALRVEEKQTEELMQEKQNAEERQLEKEKEEIQENDIENKIIEDVCQEVQVNETQSEEIAENSEVKSEVEEPLFHEMQTEEHDVENLFIENSEVESSDIKSFDIENFNVENSRDMAQESQREIQIEETTLPEDAKLCQQEIAELFFQEQKEKKQEMQFFEDGEIVAYRKITPKDFRFLHPRDAALRNNRFLAYGYENFGHLLLGRKENGQYILGVPGGYDQQERFLAGMFGFPYFKESQRIQLPKNRGGYWYRLIHTPNFHGGNGI